MSYRRLVWVSPADGTRREKKPTDPAKVPVRASDGGPVRRGDAMKAYVPSLDPVRGPVSVALPAGE